MRKGKTMAVEKTGTKQKRLNILGDDEFTAIFGRPHFTYEDRCQYFLLSQPEKDLLQRLRSVSSQAYFVLQLGYFKAKHQFFVFDLQDVEEDFQYVLQEHFNNSALADLRPIDKSTRLRQQQMILELFSYRSCGTEEREQMRKKVRQAVTVSVKPIFIFREIMDFLSEQCIVVPGYSFMQETVGQAITFEQNRLITLMQDHLKPSHIDALKALLKDSPGLYEVTQLKREPKDFSLKEIQREMDRGQQIQPLYQLARELLSQLGISNESIKYFASLVDYYSVYKLKRLDEWMVYVYLLCFVYYRYQRMNDNLISTFIYNVRRYIEEAKSAAKDQVYARDAENHQDMKKVGEVLKLFIDDSIASNTPFRKIQEKAFSILERQKLATVADQIVINEQWDESAFQWEHIDQLARQFKRHLRPLIRMIDFTSPSGNDSLMEAIYFMTQSFRQNKSLGPHASDLPHQFLPNNVKRYLYQPDSDGQKTLSVDRYEFFIYRLLRNRLEAGDVFCRESIRFRSFEDDLIDDAQWQQKDKLMADVGLTTVSQPICDHLAALEQRLEARITEVNQRIASGENDQVQIKNRGGHNRWTLPYTRDTDSLNHSFFDTLKSVDVGSVLHYVTQRCQFIDSFDHILGRYAKQTKEEQVLIACLIAWGTNMGLGRMGEISDIEYPLLVATSDNFIRLETLKEANDRVSNATSQLSIFHHFDINEVIHSSSDGQKFETGIHTIRSRHSPKYFGLKKGIVSYTMVANHIPVNARIIGANEHESHYVFDILYNNTTDIQLMYIPPIHTEPMK